MTRTGTPEDKEGTASRKETVTLELDGETVGFLRALGRPELVLEHLAQAVTGGMLGGKRHRGETDLSLRAERDGADEDAAEIRAALEATADAVILIARQRADQVLRSARAASDRVLMPPSPGNDASQAAFDRDRTKADSILDGERSAADATVERERGHRADTAVHSLAAVRETTDNNLTGERSQSDAVLLKARDANEQLVLASLRLHEMAEIAEQARDRAEESERDLRKVAEFREMFIGILGHDLRNPLSAIVTAAGLMLSRGRLDPQDAEAVARVIRSAQRMTRMIAQVLDLTRTRLGGGLPLEAKPTNLAPLCRNAIDEFEGRIELVVQGDVTGTWDPDRLSEVLSNLIGNALDYATPGTPVVVQARDEGADVVAEIANQGAPIPPEVRPFIFEPFRQAERTGKSAAGNLGLGLYIAMQIVRAHGGTLDAESAGGTTRFTVRLPRKPPG